MKSSDAFKISSVWWKKEKPPALLKSGLGEALVAYETARNAVSDKASSLQKAKVALTAVEVARKKALANCGPLFPDAKVVLKKGEQVIAAELSNLAALYNTKVLATTGPAQAEILRVAELCKGATKTAKTAAGAIPGAGKRAGKKPGDETQMKMLALAKTVAKAETLIRTNVAKLGEELNVHNRALILAAAKDPGQAAFMKSVAAAKAVLDAALAEAASLSALLDDWDTDLQAVDPNAEIERMYN